MENCIYEIVNIKEMKYIHSLCYVASCLLYVKQTELLENEHTDWQWDSVLECLPSIFKALYHHTSRSKCMEQ